MSYPKVIALKSIFDLSDDEKRSDKDELEHTWHFKSNNWSVKIFILT